MTVDREAILREWIDGNATALGGNGWRSVKDYQLIDLISRAVDAAYEDAAGVVEQYATDRLAEIVGPNGGVLPPVPSQREDIVAALRVAADRVRALIGGGE